MKIEQLQQEWETDCSIDVNKIGEESLNIAKLHSKYRKLYFAERSSLIQMKGHYKILKQEKHDFLINPTEEKVKEGWKIPAQGKLLKGDVAAYLEGDTDLVKMEMKIAIQEEKVEFVKSILDHLKTRGFLINNYIKDREWLAGQ